MHILAIAGSRNRDGQTAKSAESVIEGGARVGSEARLLFLTEMDISKCRQCDSEGWGKCRYEGRCIIEDDFQTLVEEIRKSDIVVLATPVYFGDMSESMRAFLERLRRTCITDKGMPGIGGKPAVGICHAGGSGGGSIGCTHYLETMLHHCGFDVVDMISVRRQNFTVKQEILRILGKWLVESQML